MIGGSHSALGSNYNSVLQWWEQLVSDHILQSVDTAHLWLLRLWISPTFMRASWLRSPPIITSYLGDPTAPTEDHVSGILS
jgi:hypothetical protein